MAKTGSKTTKVTKPAKAEGETKPRTKTDRGTLVSTVLDAPVPDDRREDREDDASRRERRGPKEDINADPRTREDRVFDVATRARWGGVETIAELNADAAESEASAAGNQE